MTPSRSDIDQLGLFDRFYDPLLETFRSRLRTRLEEKADPDGLLDVDEIVDVAVADHGEQLIGLCSRALIYEFHQWRRGVTGGSPDGHAHYDQFVEQVGTGVGHADFLARYPVLRDLLAVALDRRLDLLTQAVRRYLADHEDLVEAGLVTAGVLRRIRCSSGDLHNGGQKVLVFELATGRLVYKPRHLHTDRFVQAVLDEVNHDLAAADAVRLPATVVRADHGWQAFVEAADNADVTDVRRFFRRTGVFLGVFTALGSSDMHYENLIAARGEPLFIDLETFVQRTRTTTEPATLYEAFYQRVAATVLGTMLLPARLVGAVFDIDISGLGNTTPQVSQRWQTYTVTGAGTDAVRFDKQKVAVAHGGNACTLGGVPVHPADFADDLQAGFRAATESLRRRHAAITAIMAAAEWSEIPVRQVLRPTAVYFRFLEASTHPRYLSSPQTRRDLLARLRPHPGLPDELAPWVLDQEIAALTVGDIPYFAADFGGYDLIANTTTTLVDAYPASLRRQVHEQFTANVGQPVAENEYLIGAALLTSVEDSWATEEDTRAHCLAGLFEPGDAITVSRRIGDFLHDTAVWQSDRTRCGWITPVFTGPDELTLDLNDFTLYESGGTLLFLAELAAVTDDRRYAQLARAGVPESTRWPILGDRDPDLSAFSGAGSTLYLLSRLATLLDDRALAAARDEQLEALQLVDFTAVTSADYVGGLAGLGVVLANLTAQHPHSPAELVLRKLAPVLSARARGLDARHLAHGEIGTVLALGRAGVALADASLLHQARAALRRLLRTGQLLSGEGNWCWGAAGAIQASARVMTDVGISLEEARAILAEPIDTILNAPSADNGDLSLCHGAAGNSRALADACRLLGDVEGARRAHQQLLAVLRTVPERGYRGGLAHSAGLPTFMLGLSGVGHALLEPAGLPSALLLELEHPSC